MEEEFISERIKPVISTADTRRMAAGGPGLPGEFFWRDKKYTVKNVIKEWKTTKPCNCGSGEKYVRKHWYQIETMDNKVMEIYFDRQPNAGRKQMGWFLFTVKNSK